MTEQASKRANSAGRSVQTYGHRLPRAPEVEILHPRQKAPGPQDDIRQLGDLISIGPAMLRDFELLGIRSVAQLATKNPQRLYEKLGRVARQHQDICVLDTFCAAVAQAKNPRLPAEKCQWSYWSKKRKTGNK
jgi:hypothetical protein